MKDLEHGGHILILENRRLVLNFYRQWVKGSHRLFELFYYQDNGKYDTKRLDILVIWSDALESMIKGT